MGWARISARFNWKTRREEIRWVICKYKDESEGKTEYYGVF